MIRLPTPTGVRLVEDWEGLFLTASRDIAGVWTIGYGHTGGVMKGDMITVAQADQLLTLDLAAAAAEVEARAPQATDPQFDAMTSLTFNIGIDAFRGSTLLRLFKAGDIEGAAWQFLRWDKAHVNGQLVVVQGLLNRRISEQKLFVTGNYARPPATELYFYYEGKKWQGRNP